MGNSATLGETESPSVADKSGISKAASAGATSIKSLTGATESLSFKGSTTSFVIPEIPIAADSVATRIDFDTNISNSFVRI